MTDTCSIGGGPGTGHVNVANSNLAAAGGRASGTPGT